jgi:hypothetical protein
MDQVSHSLPGSLRRRKGGNIAWTNARCNKVDDFFVDLEHIDRLFSAECESNRNSSHIAGKLDHQRD